MWVRKRIDIGWSDLSHGLWQCAFPPRREQAARQLEDFWSPEGGPLACLSVRSGFDLLLRQLAFPSGTEVLISAVTIPDMVRILKEHGLVPIPVDLEVGRMAPPPDLWRRAVSAKTRAIVVTHLFGARMDLEPVLELARQHGLFVIEDCAQAYDGPGCNGHPQADVSMFSFGSIKTATALGGGLLQIKDRELLARMRQVQETYPVQKHEEHLGRLLKYAVIRLFSLRPLFAVVERLSRLIWGDADQLLNGVARGFPGPDFFDRIRRQPSAALLALMLRRLRSYDPARIRLRARLGENLRDLLGPVVCPGSNQARHTYWLFPILANEPARAMAALRWTGFDATQGQSLTVVDPPDDRPELEPSSARQALAQMVFLPFYPEMPESALRRMAEVLSGVLPVG